MEVVIVTGSAQGIGLSIAEYYARAGALVFGIDLTPQQSHGNFVACEVDIADRGAVASCFAEIRSRVDRVDLLVNNAGVWNDCALTHGDFESQAEAFSQALGSGLAGSYLVTLAAVPLLAASENANIINMLTEHIEPGHYITGLPATGYDCAKFGLWRLTESWAIELKKKGIRVNGLSFGATDTPMLRAVAPQAAESGMLAEDITLAVQNVVAQGAGGDTGRSYLFGCNGTPRQTSLEEISRLAQPSD